MGIHDRDYYREDETPQGFHLGGRRTMVTNIVLVTVAFFVVDSFTDTTYYLVATKGNDSIQGIYVEHAVERAKEDFRALGYKVDVLRGGRWLSDWLMLRVDLFQHPWNLWQLVSYGFAHSPIGGDRFWLFHIAFNMFVLWTFGRSIEEKYGAREFTLFYFAAIIFSGLVWVGIQNLLYDNFGPGGVIGASGAVTAIVILFVMNFPNQMLLLLGVFPMRAWILGLILVGLDFLSALGSNDRIAHEAHLAGAAFALLYYRFGLRFEKLVPKKLSSAGKWLTSKPKLRVHAPEENDETYRELDQEADRILDKLHRQGDASLTAKERRVLEAYSRRMRQKRR